MKVLPCIGLLVFFIAAPAFGQRPDKRLLVRILQVPQRVIIDGKRVVYYELQLKNISSDTFHLRRVEISGAGPLLSIEGSDLDERMSDVVLTPQHTSTLYIELENLQADDSLLNHQLEYAFPIKDKEPGVFRLSVVTSIAKAPAPVLSAPLREGNWAAIYSPVWQRGHRRVCFTFDDTDYLPGRFAIDFVRLDSVGRYASGNEDSVANWYGYGNAVYAVADGAVVAMRTDFTESPTLSGHPAYAAADATGNFVAVDIGHGQVVFYEHLRPGSIPVSRGQRVRKGQVLGAIGFTGQSTGPHLHLHVANAPLPLRAEGLPFVFLDFQLVGRYPDFGVFGKSVWSSVKASARVVRERPAPNTVIRFTQR
ncbi:M23 family metallopeptidase [Parachryseolinea silvisoli]|uniref:M23 family metallopeptidase n=1 Tax=Parachryseolinea silvisoli TaxID=2873601 RepID=UPI0022657EA0|nr:M23 family metallopeptidase [Parachryseolinea silvisoli]MCD9016629.1 M23 family metallopeptidase [Parachryseolinea silvisoli]